MEADPPRRAHSARFFDFIGLQFSCARLPPDPEEGNNGAGTGGKDALGIVSRARALRRSVARSPDTRSRGAPSIIPPAAPVAMRAGACACLGAAHPHL